jgi:alanine racemase
VCCVKLYAMKPVAEINLNQYQINIEQIRKIIGSSVKLLVAVKANGYGLGAVPISKKAEELGVDYLGVAHIEEAIELRSNNIKLPILLFSEPIDSQLIKLICFNIIPTIYHIDFAKKLNQVASNLNVIVHVHVKVDTGMNRLGVKANDAFLFIQKISRLSHLRIEGIYSHFAHADNALNPYTSNQLELFKSLLKDLDVLDISIPIKHCANSDATFKFPDSHMNMVRCGIYTYKDVLTIKGKVSALRQINSGESVSYGCEFTAKEKTIIATIHSGYADGIPKSLSNKGRVLINGNFYPIIGRICMDMFMIDLGNNIENVKLHETAVILGTSDKNTISMEEVCAHTNMIPYEILCGLNQRTKRIYIN